MGRNNAGENKTLRKINKIKFKGDRRTKEEREFLKTIRHAKGGDKLYKDMVKKKSGPVEVYYDESVKRTNGGAKSDY